ncbi:LOW QUALITY PROTEIN: transmembrane 4 L6 family member 5-like [Sceloporus undulatus]|uniref:LOW QUALITY PROTEIN: transmembrane 4 L6 family member 5-like n=1 Tax=Sceloporus undulatus TaxID=8520 RepID=UPI001C4D3CD5|nr:LOW QUALITY PROTEIN: transmembrane 4 L6 family member 5-like [Sceloporus undulatus]
MCTGACSRVVGAALWPFALLAIVANVLLAFPDWKTEYVHDFGQHLTPEVLYLGGLVGGGVMVLIPAIHIQATGSHGCCGNRCGMFLSVLLAAVGAVGATYAIVVSMLGLAHGPPCQYLQNGTHLDWGRPFEHSEEPLRGQFGKPERVASVALRATLQGSTAGQQDLSLIGGGWPGGPKMGGSSPLANTLLCQTAMPAQWMLRARGAEQMSARWPLVVPSCPPTVFSLLCASKDSYLFNAEMWDICKDPPRVILFNVVLFSLILGAGLAELGLCLVQIFNGLFGCVCGTCREEKTLETYN